MSTKMIIVNRPRQSTPMLQQFHSALVTDPDLEVFISGDLMTPLPDLAEQAGFMPDLILGGYNAVPMVANDKTYMGGGETWMSRNNVKFVCEVGDPFLLPLNSGMPIYEDGGANIDLFLSRIAWKLPESIAAAKERWPNALGDADFQYIPWCADFNVYKPWERHHKDFDASCMATVSKYNLQWSYRMDYINTWKKLQAEGKWKIFVGNKYGEEQLRQLRRTKVIAIDTLAKGGQSFMTQRFVEAGLSGCLLIGEKPEDHDNLLHDGKTMIIVDNFKDELEEQFLYYMDNPEERVKITTSYKEALIASRPVSRAVEIFKSAIKRVL